MLIEKENVSRTLDSLGRITIPKSLRNRLNFGVDEQYEFFTVEIDGVKYIAIGKSEVPMDLKSDRDSK